jgi:multicomponent Na+:H+ antiporter subunit G
MVLALEIAAFICLTIGLLFFLGTIVGILRFPTFYTRMHAAGKADTLSSLLILLAFVLLQLRDPQVHHLLTCGKLIMIMGFIFVASPTATHALMDAGYKSAGGEEGDADS